MQQPLGLLTAVLLASLIPNSAMSDSRMFTVAGDVERPETYDIPSREPVFCLDLLVKAGLRPESKGTACLFRGNPPQFIDSTQLSATGSDRGWELNPGDIVVFHDRTESVAVSSNVVIHTGGIPRVARLTESGNTLAELLNLLEVKFSTDERFPLQRTEGGLVYRIEAYPEEFLLPGDVVMLSVVKDVAPSVIDRLFSPVVSVSPVSNSADVSSESPEPRNLKDVESGESSFTKTIVDSPAFPPLSNANSVTAETEPQDFAEAFHISNFTSNPDIEVSIPDQQSFLVTTADQIRPAESSERNDAVPRITTIASEHPFTEPGVIQNVSSSHRGSLPPDLQAQIEFPAQSQTEMTVSDSGTSSAVWNAVFVFGLFGAIVLITTGWLKTQAEQKSIAVRARELMNLTVGDSISEAESPERFSSPASTTNTQLEQLIQNRIPMQLRQANLPLRVTLFGRPAGPQRLRVDAAHKQIGAPHFASTSRQQSRQREQLHTSTTGPETEERGSLDRALSSLKGHAKS